jgi:hypothetical protein
MMHVPERHQVNVFIAESLLFALGTGALSLAVPLSQLAEDRLQGRARACGGRSFFKLFLGQFTKATNLGQERVFARAGRKGAKERGGNVLAKVRLSVQDLVVHDDGDFALPGRACRAGRTLSRQKLPCCLEHVHEGNG